VLSDVLGIWRIDIVAEVAVRQCRIVGGGQRANDDAYRPPVFAGQVPGETIGDPGDAFLERKVRKPCHHHVYELVRAKLRVHGCQLGGERGDLVPVEELVLQQGPRRPGHS
jgi:hypothetical protein